MQILRNFLVGSPGRPPCHSPTGEAVYFKSITLRNISSETILFGELERQITDLQTWSLEQNR